MMIKAAIVEDESECAETLAAYIDRYAKATGESISVERFADGSEFLKDFRPIYDIVFMDIEMPGVDGLDTAKYLREVDALVCIVFVTNMAQYAIKGYEVNAMDFIVKPVTYSDLSYRMKKIMSYVHGLENKRDVVIRYKNDIFRVNVADIRFVEVNDYMLDWHLTGADGASVVKNSVETLSDAEARLPAAMFAKCNKGVLVNLMYVSELRGNDVIVGSDVLPLSRSKRRGFVDRVTTFNGGGRNG